MLYMDELIIPSILSKLFGPKYVMACNLFQKIIHCALLIIKYPNIALNIMESLYTQPMDFGKLLALCNYYKFAYITIQVSNVQ